MKGKVILILLLLLFISACSRDNNLDREYRFELDTYGAGEIEDSGEFVGIHQQMTLEAVAKEGWGFIEWRGQLKGNQNPVVIVTEAEMQIQAEFWEIPQVPDFPTFDDNWTFDAGWQKLENSEQWTAFEIETAYDRDELEEQGRLEEKRVRLEEGEKVKIQLSRENLYSDSEQEYNDAGARYIYLGLGYAEDIEYEISGDLPSFIEYRINANNLIIESLETTGVDLEDYILELKLSNGELESRANITISINDEPELRRIDKDVKEGEILTFDLADYVEDANEADFEIMEYELIAGRAELEADGKLSFANGQLSWKVDYGIVAKGDEEKIFELGFWVSDLMADDEREDIRFRVQRVNREPLFGDVSGEVEEIGKQEIHEAQEISFVVSGFDPDERYETVVEAIDIPPGASFDANSGSFSWVPSYGDAGDYQAQFLIRAKDDEIEVSSTKIVEIKVISEGDEDFEKRVGDLVLDLDIQGEIDVESEDEIEIIEVKLSLEKDGNNLAYDFDYGKKIRVDDLVVGDYETKVKLWGSIRNEDSYKKLYQGELDLEIEADTQTQDIIKLNPLPAQSLDITVKSNTEVEEITLELNGKEISKSANQVQFKDLTPGYWQVTIKLENDESGQRELLLLPTEVKEVKLEVAEKTGDTIVIIDVHESLTKLSNLRIEGADLVWDEQDAAIAYAIYRSRDGDVNNRYYLTTVGENRYQDVEQGYYWVRALDSQGYTGEISDVIEVK